MPNPPRFILPPALFARVEALRAAAPVPPSRQAVVEAALGRGLDALAGLPPGLVPALAPYAWALLRALPGCGVPGCWRAATRGHAYSPAAADLRCDDCDPAGPGEASQWGDLAYAAVVRAAVVGAEQAARGGADGREGVGRAGDASRGQPRAPVGFGAFTPAPNDPRWATDAAGTYYACEAHTVGAMAPNGRRVTVAVAAGDTVNVVERGLEAAWRASEQRGRVG